MPTGIEEATVAIILAKLATGMADVASGVQALAEMIKAQEGLKYNLYTFSLRDSTETTNQAEKPKAPASDKQPASFGTKAALNIPSQKEAFILELMVKGVEGSSLLHCVAAFQLAWITIGSSTAGYVRLNALLGFDTGIGSQAQVEFDGRDVEGGHLITFKGFVNQVGPGFGHFSGAVLFDARKGTIRTVAGQIVPQEAGKVTNVGECVAFVF